MEQQQSDAVPNGVPPQMHKSQLSVSHLRWGENGRSNGSSSTNNTSLGGIIRADHGQSKPPYANIALAHQRTGFVLFCNIVAPCVHRVDGHEVTLYTMGHCECV